MSFERLESSPPVGCQLLDYSAGTRVPVTATGHKTVHSVTHRHSCDISSRLLGPPLAALTYRPLVNPSSTCSDFSSSPSIHHLLSHLSSNPPTSSLPPLVIPPTDPRSSPSQPSSPAGQSCSHSDPLRLHLTDAHQRGTREARGSGRCDWSRDPSMRRRQTPSTMGNA